MRRPVSFTGALINCSLPAWSCSLQQERLSCSRTLRCIQGLGYFLGILLVTAESVLFFERRRCFLLLSCCPDDSPGGRELVNAEQKSDYRQLQLHLNNCSTIILSFILIHVNATH